MNDVLITIAISIITNGTLLGLFIWVFKRLFDSALTKRAEMFKQEIALINKKNFYQYSKFYDEQVQAIKDVYGDLVDMVGQVDYIAYRVKLIEEHPELFEHYLMPKNGDPFKWERYYESFNPTNEEIKSKELSKKASAAIKDFRKKRIYFARYIADEIDRLIFSIWFIADNFKSVSFRDPYNFEPGVNQELIETWHNAIILISKLFPELEESFREHIIVNDLKK
jgi:hypothetical protein